MTAADYADWSAAHADTFGLNSDADERMFRAWFDVFRLAGYTAGELAAATRAMAMQPPKWRSDHLAAIHASVGTRRRAEARARQVARAADDRGVCIHCRDTGWAEVPHPKFTADGHCTDLCAAACWCFKGREITRSQEERYQRDGGKNHPPSLTLSDVERSLPGWQAVLAEYRERLRASARAEHASRAADGAGGPLAATMQRILERAAGSPN